MESTNTDMSKMTGALLVFTPSSKSPVILGFGSWNE